MKKRRAAATRAGGFTLLEILVAISLLGVALTVVFELFSGSLRNIRASEDYVQAALEGEVSLRKILSDDNLKAGTFTEVTPNGYRMEATISEALQEKSENLQCRVMEIDLAVKWRKGAKERVTHLRTVRLVNKPPQEGAVGRATGM